MRQRDIEGLPSELHPQTCFYEFILNNVCKIECVGKEAESLSIAYQARDGNNKIGCWHFLRLIYLQGRGYLNIFWAYFDGYVIGEKR